LNLAGEIREVLELCHEYAALRGSQPSHINGIIASLEHMLAVIDVIGRETQLPQARQALLRHVRLVQAESQAGDLIKQDRQLIALTSETLTTKLNGTPVEKPHQHARGLVQ
jgi:hypothetical protein